MRSTSALFLIFSGSALAFAPASRKSTSSALKVSPELQKMVGASVETGNKIVSMLYIQSSLMARIALFVLIRPFFLV
jgi:chromatin remodeling complex protein RSC6